MYLSRNVTMKVFLYLFASLALLFHASNISAQLSQQGGFPQAIGAGGFGYSSPVFGNLDNDSDLEIVVGSFDGKVYAFNPDGSKFFVYNTGTAIDATPTLADIDGDGRLEIIVTLGSSVASTQRGGIIVLENDGTLKSKLDGTEAQNSRNGVPASPTLIIPGDFLPEGVGDGNADYVDGSVAVRDIDGDGSPDLVFGANDTNIYALRNDLTLVDSRTDDDGDGKINEDPGWERKGAGQRDDDGDISTRCSGKPTPDPCLDEDPIDWPVTNQDTLSSTPALGDVDGDGDIEVVIGGGSSASAASTCQEGGTIWVLHHTGNADKARFGTKIPGTNVVRLAPTGCTKAAIFSSPALVDIDNDNKLEIFVGTASDTPSAKRPNVNPNLVYGLKYNASNNTLENLPGWPVSTGGFINASPAIGDIDGDGKLEIVVASGSPDGKIYAFHANGSPVQGFPVKPTSIGIGTSGSPALADVNGDGRADIVVGNGFDLFAYDGSGKRLEGFGGSTFYGPDTITRSDGPINSTPAVGDIDNDGKVEIAWVSSDGKLYVIKAEKNTGVLPWPMFHRNAAHTGVYTGVYELNDQPPADVITVSTNKTSYSEKDTMTFSWSINNAGSKGFKADVFLGAAFPNGDLLFFTSLKGDSFITIPAAQGGDTRNFKPAASSYDITANLTVPQTTFFSYGPLPKGPGGTFTIFAALAKPGTVQAGAPQIIGISIGNFTY